MGVFAVVFSSPIEETIAEPLLDHFSSLQPFFFFFCSKMLFTKP